MAPLTEDLGPSPTLGKLDKSNTNTNTNSNTATTAAPKSRHGKSDTTQASNPHSARGNAKSNTQTPPPSTNTTTTTGNDQAPRYGRRAGQANATQVVGAEGFEAGTAGFINATNAPATTTSVGVVGGVYGSGNTTVKSAPKSGNANEDGAAVPLPSATRGGTDGPGMGTGWFDISKERPKDKELGAVPTVSDDVDEQTQLEQQRKSKEAREKLAQAVPDAAVGYQTAMPTLSDLDITNHWDRLLQVIHSEFDMSCLTTCLVRELDEDAAWNPDMLLVQLTSDMLDAAELKQESGFGPGQNGTAVEDAIGTMQGGEVPTVRRRRERNATSPTANNNNNNNTSNNNSISNSGSTGKNNANVNMKADVGEKGKAGPTTNATRNNGAAMPRSPHKRPAGGNSNADVKSKAEATTTTTKKNNATVPLTSTIVATVSPTRAGRGGKGEAPREAKKA